MLYREIIAVCSEIHTKHINILCGQNVELLNVKLAVHIVTTGGTYSEHWGGSCTSDACVRVCVCVCVCVCDKIPDILTLCYGLIRLLEFLVV